MDIDQASHNFETACQLVLQGEFELAYQYVSEALEVARSQGNALAIGACLSVIGTFTGPEVISKQPKLAFWIGSLRVEG